MCQYCADVATTGGEVAASVADVAALEEHLPAVLRQHTADIQSAPLVMLDGNLSPEALLVRPKLSICFLTSDARNLLWPKGCALSQLSTSVSSNFCAFGSCTCLRKQRAGLPDLDRGQSCSQLCTLGQVINVELEFGTVTWMVFILSTGTRKPHFRPAGQITFS